MIGWARTDTSILGRWWWTVDRWSLGALGLLVGFGAVLIVAASPPVAERLNVDEFHFVRRHLAMLVPAVLILIGTSILSPTGVRRLSALADKAVNLETKLASERQAHAAHAEQLQTQHARALEQAENKFAAVSKVG